MLMQIPEWLVGMEVRSKPSAPSFASFEEAQIDLFIESMQDAADDHWHELQWKMHGASQAEVGAEMERWWNRHIRRFRFRLREEHRRDQQRLLNRRLRRETRRRRAAEDQLQVAEVELQQTSDVLVASREYATYLEGQFRCRECDSRSWY